MTTRILLLLLFIVGAYAVTNCGIGVDPFFATVSFNARHDMWRADAIVTDYDATGASTQTHPRHHWETRTINSRCIIKRTVFLILDGAVYVYQQKIFPPVEGAYQIQEYVPTKRQFRTVDCHATRVNPTLINITSAWTIGRLITVVEPHYSYHENIVMSDSSTATLYTVATPTQQNDIVVAARKAFEAGELENTSEHPFPSLVFIPSQ